ncbi:MAG: flippase [Pseudomonadota bacterium]
MTGPPTETQAAGRRVVKNSLFMFGQNALVTAASVFITALIARHLGKAEYGIFNYCFSFVSLFYILSALGLRSVTVRAVAQKGGALERYVGLVISLRMLLAAVAVPILLVISELLHTDRRILFGVGIVAWTVLSNAFSMSLRDILQGFEKMSYEAASALVVRAFTLIGSLAVILLGGGLYPLIWIYALGSLASCAVPMFGFRRRKLSIAPRWDNFEALAELRKGLPFALNGMLAIFIGKINPILLGNLSTPEMVGVFYAAISFYTIFQTIPDAIATSLFPTVSRGYTDPSVRVAPILQRVFFYCLLLSLPISIGGMLCANPIIRLVFGSRFLEAIPVFQVLMIALPFEFLSLPSNYVLGAIHRQNAVLVLSVGAAVVNVTSCFLLVPRYGAIGTATAVVITGSLYAIGSILTLSRSYPLRSEGARYIKLLVCLGGMAAALYPVRHASPFVSVPLGAAIYGLMLLATRLLSIEQAIDFARQALGGRKRV